MGRKNRCNIGLVLMVCGFYEKTCLASTGPFNNGALTNPETRTLVLGAFEYFIHYYHIGFFIIILLILMIFLYQEKKREFKKLEKTLNEIPTGICVIDLNKDGRIILANKSFYELRGYSAEEAKSLKDISLYDRAIESQHAEIRKFVEQIKNSENVEQSEVTVHHRDGREINLLSKFYVNRQNMTATISFSDITARKRTETELEISKERYRLALTQSGKNFYYFDIPTRMVHLSKKLAETLGIPQDIPNMPDNPILNKFLDPQSLEVYKEFYNKIIQGQTSGEALVACHSLQKPKNNYWFHMGFNTVYNENKKSMSAIITYENWDEQHQSELAKAWRPQNLLSVSEKEWVIVEYNLSRDKYIRQKGGLFEEVDVEDPSYDGIAAFVLNNFVAAEDRERYGQFLDRNRLLKGFKEGVCEDVIEYRATQDTATQRWTRTTIQLVKDPYSEDVMAQLLIQDINAEKTGQLEMKHSMEELRKELENSRIRIMINQMQPHFLYNALSAIQTIVKTDPDYAYKLIFDFTVHLRASIKALSSDKPIPFVDELKNINAYLNIEQMRFGHKLQIVYDIQCKDFMVIPLSIQPLAENAARHGIYPRGDRGGTITIRTYETLTDYVVEVDDDGIGFDVDKVMKMNTDSIGLKNMMFRMKSLMNAEVTIVSKINAGTKATVRIPIDEETDKGGHTL